MARSKPFRRMLKTECLETRALMAGDVTATVMNGTLFITGDDQANQIEVRAGQTAGQYVITGQAGSDGAATTIGGNTDPVTIDGAVRNVFINLRGGDDTLTVVDLTANSGLYISMGAGNDTVTLGAVSTGVTTGAASLAKAIASANVRGDLIIDLGIGDDTLTQYASNMTRGEIINAGAGDDTVKLDGSALTEGISVGQNLVINMGFGDDDLETVAVHVAKNLLITDLDGDDFIALARVFAQRASIDALFGPDQVRIVGSQFDNLQIALGPGDDKLQIGSTKVTGAALFDGGIGHDTYENLTDVGANDLARATTIRFEEMIGVTTTPIAQPRPIIGLIDFLIGLFGGRR